MHLSLGGRGSLMVKVTDLWLACHELELSAAKDPPCRGGHCTFNLSKLKSNSIGVELMSNSNSAIMNAEHLLICPELDNESQKLGSDIPTFIFPDPSTYLMTEHFLPSTFNFQSHCPSGIVVGDADCGAVGPGFESRRRHGCL
ncbi:hypothetical protein TNCV_2857071 [Trichonephila clavipes]|nr:hypothetical protein TNCV_2857071 [Trichonephila clavipes]